MMTDYNDEIIDMEFDEPIFNEELRDMCDRVVEYWEEDYEFSELLEEFNLTTKDAFYALVQTGMIDPEDMEAFSIGE